MRPSQAPKPTVRTAHAHASLVLLQDGQHEIVARRIMRCSEGDRLEGLFHRLCHGTVYDQAVVLKVESSSDEQGWVEVEDLCMDVLELVQDFGNRYLRFTAHDRLQSADLMPVSPYIDADAPEPTATACDPRRSSHANGPAHPSDRGAEEAIYAPVARDSERQAPLHEAHAHSTASEDDRVFDGGESDEESNVELSSIPDSDPASSVNGEHEDDDLIDWDGMPIDDLPPVAAPSAPSPQLVETEDEPERKYSSGAELPTSSDSDKRSADACTAHHNLALMDGRPDRPDCSRSPRRDTVAHVEVQCTSKHKSLHQNASWIPAPPHPAAPLSVAVPRKSGSNFHDAAAAVDHRSSAPPNLPPHDPLETFFRSRQSGSQQRSSRSPPHLAAPPPVLVSRKSVRNLHDAAAAVDHPSSAPPNLPPHDPLETFFRSRQSGSQQRSSHSPPHLAAPPPVLVSRKSVRNLHDAAAAVDPPSSAPPNLPPHDPLETFFRSRQSGSQQRSSHSPPHLAAPPPVLVSRKSVRNLHDAAAAVDHPSPAPPTPPLHDPLETFFKSRQSGGQQRRFPCHPPFPSSDALDSFSRSKRSRSRQKESHLHHSSRSKKSRSRRRHSHQHQSSQSRRSRSRIRSSRQQHSKHNLHRCPDGESDRVVIGRIWCNLLEEFEERTNLCDLDLLDWAVDHGGCKELWPLGYLVASGELGLRPVDDCTMLEFHARQTLFGMFGGMNQPLAPTLSVQCLLGLLHKRSYEDLGSHVSPLGYIKPVSGQNWHTHDFLSNATWRFRERWWPCQLCLLPQVCHGCFDHLFFPSNGSIEKHMSWMMPGKRSSRSCSAFPSDIMLDSEWNPSVHSRILDMAKPQLSARAVCNVPGLVVNMRGYQAQAVNWMCRQETELERAIVPSRALQFPDSRGCWHYCEASGEMSLTPCGVHGGILASEVGMGKTLMSIALGLRNGFRKNSMSQEKAAKHLGNDMLRGGTLIIAPPILVAQWVEEVRKLTGGAVHPILSAKAPSRSALVAADLVIASSQELRHQNSSWRWSTSALDADQKSTRCSILHAVLWHRIIFDECHGLRGRDSRLASSLRARNRWFVSGTPFNNSGGSCSLTWLLEAVLGQPFRGGICMRSFAKGRVKDDSPVSETQDLERFMSEITLRHEKADKYLCGTPFLELPPLKYHARRGGTVTLRELQAYHQEQAKQRRYVAWVIEDARSRGVRVGSILGKHEFNKLMTITSNARVAEAAKVVDEIIRRDGDAAKFLVFANYEETLAGIEAVFKQQGIKFVRPNKDSSEQASNILRPQLQGINEREASKLQEFERPGGSVRACIFSTGLGNAGLNLQSANHILFVDTPNYVFVERQAVGRCHRYGQERRVHVWHFPTPGAVEDLLHERGSRYRQRRPAVESDCGEAAAAMGTSCITDGPVLVGDLDLQEHAAALAAIPTMVGYDDLAVGVSVQILSSSCTDFGRKYIGHCGTVEDIDEPRLKVRFGDGRSDWYDERDVEICVSDQLATDPGEL